MSKELQNLIKEKKLTLIKQFYENKDNSHIIPNP